MAGANPAMVVRIAANIEELRKALQQGGDVINTTTAALNKMVTSFSGDRLIQQAQNVAAAISQIGGVSKLTAAEQERVHGTVSRALEKYQALGRDAPKALIDIEAATRQASSGWQGFGAIFSQVDTQFRSTLAGFVSAQAIIGTVTGAWRSFTGFIGSSVTEFLDAEAAQSKLTAALRTSGQVAPQTINAYNDLSKAFERTTVFGDDLITEMQALMVQVGGVMPSQMEGALKAATDLSAGLGIDLRQSTMLVAKAFEGSTETLKRYGIVIDEAKLKAEGMPAVLEAINSKFGGQAQAQIETTAGKLQQLGNAWDNIKEAIGGAIVTDPLVQKFLTGITQSAKDAQSAIEQLGKAQTEQEKDQIRATEALAQFNLENDTMVTQFFLRTIPGLEAARHEVDNLRASYEEAALEAAALAKATAAIKPVTGLVPGTPGPVPVPPGTIESFKQAEEAAKKAKAAAEAYAKSVETLRAQLSGAALEGDLKKLLAAWQGLSAQQQADQAVIGRVVEEYRKLREQGVSSALLDNLGEMHRINLLLNQDYRNLAISLPAFTLPLARMHENLRTNQTFLQSFATTLGVDIQNAITRNVIAIDAHEAATQKWLRPVKDASTASIDWAKNISNLSRAFSELAQTSGGLSGFAKAIGEITSAMSIAAQAGEQASQSLRTAFKGTMFDPETGKVLAGENADYQERGEAVMQLAVTVIQAIAAIDAATQGTSVGKAILGGAITGATFGFAIGGGIGAGIGAAIGAITGAIRASAQKSDEVMKEAGRDLGIALSESLSKQIEEDAKVIFGGSSAAFRTVARAFNLDAIIKEQGGIRTATMFEKFTGELHNMLGFVEQGRMTAEQAVDAIGRAFPAFAAYLANSRELATKTWTDFLEHHKNLGLKTKEITDFVLSGAGRIATAISGMLAPVLKEYGGLADKIAKTTDAAELAGLLEKQAEGAAKAGESLKQMGTLALSAFSAAREQGASYLQAIRATAPAVQQLTGLYRDLGLELPTADENFALRWLLDQQALIDKMPELVTAQEAVNEAALAFSHIGKLNVENLGILGAQAAKTYDQMIAGGFGSAEALAQVQDFLRLARQRYQELGVPIDENTQRLLDMADAAGLSTEPMRTTGQIFEEVADTLKEGLGAIITLLGGELPKSWQKAAAATEQAATESEKSMTDMRLKVASEYQVILTDSASKSGQVAQTWKNCWNRSTWGTSEINHMFDQVVSGAEDAAGQVEDIFDTLTLPTLELGYKYTLEGEGLPTEFGGGGIEPVAPFAAGEAGFRSVVVAGSSGPVTLVNPRSAERDLLSEMRQMNQLLAKSTETPSVVVVPLGPDESWESFSARLSRTMPVRVAKSSTLQDAWRRAVPSK